MVHDLITHIVESTVKQRTLEQEEQICYLQGMVDSLTSKVHQLEEKIEKQQVVSDHLEQYSRRHSVRIVNNWPEEPDEDTDMKVVGMVNDCLNIGIDREDIDRSHRVGRPSANKPRPVIAKFISYRTKASIYKARNKLKFAGNGAHRVFINEDLTKTRMSMFHIALKLKRDNLVTDTWTTDGNVFVKDRKLVTKMFTDLESIKIFESDLRGNPPLLYSDAIRV